MHFEYAYKGSSVARTLERRTELSFSPDTTRAPTYFSGELANAVPFREAISALHDVVVSDLRYKPKDREAYRAWLATQELVDLEALAGRRAGVASRMRELREELAELDRRHASRFRPFYAARQRYFDYLYQKDRDAWIVLDPVVTVHPDEVFFECFSQDESTYGRLGVSYDDFANVGALSCGTTNVDYSAALYDEFQKIRSYRTTKFGVDPGGFEVKTEGEADYKEVKIDLPDSWVRGFLQVSSAMSLPARSFDLHPMDVHAICLLLRRKKEKLGPRALRYVLTPGESVRVVLEPWGTEIVCRRTTYEGKEREEIRVWGRRRLFVLERLVAVSRRFRVHLLGTGMPSFYVADLGTMSFTLGLSGWTANDWARAGNFDLLAPRAEVDDFTKRRVFEALKGRWLAKPDALAKDLGLSRAVVRGALSAYTQGGRAIFDLHKQVYRARELSREPLPLDKLRFSNEREARASRFLDAGAVVVRDARVDQDGTLSLSGTVKDGPRALSPSLVVDPDARLSAAECSCRFFAQNKLFKGPCEHVLALRMQHVRGRH